MDYHTGKTDKLYADSVELIFFVISQMFIYSFLWDFMQRLAMFLAYVYISELTGQRQCVFLLVKRFPRPAASLLWWTLAPMTTPDRHGRQRPRRRGMPRPAL